MWFEKKKGTANLWSVDIDANYRAVGLRRDPDIYWFFIGTHVEYERLLADKRKLPALPPKPSG